MDDTEFTKLADDVIQKISDALEVADEEFVLEIDLLEGVLNIELDDGRTYVINKHSASKQVWLSSPISGASHFSYNLGNSSWLDSKGNNLSDVIASELEEAVGLSVVL